LTDSERAHCPMVKLGLVFLFVRSHVLRLEGGLYTRVDDDQTAQGGIGLGNVFGMEMDMLVSVRGQEEG
jgi:hypothetical protein